jgi:hypothetical protein
MAIPIATVLKPVYRKVGALGVQAVVTLYLVYRYGRAFMDQDFAQRLCSEDLQASWVVDIPFVWITALTPVIVWVLAEWSRRDAGSDSRKARRLTVQVISAVVPLMAALFVARAHAICAKDIWSPLLWRPETSLVVYGSLCGISSVRVLWLAVLSRRSFAHAGGPQKVPPVS